MTLLEKETWLKTHGDRNFDDLLSDENGNYVMMRGKNGHRRRVYLEGEVIKGVFYKTT
jgi:hypothetical protein